MNRPFIPPERLERIFDDSPWNNPASYRPANDDGLGDPVENLARFYRANPQFGPRPRVWQVVVAVAFVYLLLLAAMVVLA